MGDMIPDGYRILVHFDTAKERFVAVVPELGDLRADGESRGDALSKAEQAIEETIRKSAEGEDSLPTPVDRTGFSGELTIRISPSLHRELAFLAVEDGMDVDGLAAELITTGVAIKTRGRLNTPARAEGGNREERDGNQHRGNRHNRKDYHAIMDDRASFIEYVRNIDTGNKRGQSGGGGGGGRSRSRGRRK